MLNRNILISIIALVILIIIIILIVVLTKNGKESGTDNGKESGTDHGNESVPMDITISLPDGSTGTFVMFDKNSCPSVSDNCFPEDILSLYTVDETNPADIPINATHIRDDATIHKNKSLIVKPSFSSNSLLLYYVLQYDSRSVDDFKDGDIIRFINNSI